MFNCWATDGTIAADGNPEPSNWYSTRDHKGFSKTTTPLRSHTTGQLATSPTLCTSNIKATRMTTEQHEPRPIQTGDTIEVLITHGGGYKDADQSIYTGGVEDWRSATVGKHIYDLHFVLTVDGLGPYLNGTSKRTWDKTQGAWVGGSPFPIRAVRPKHVDAYEPDTPS